MNIHGDTPIYSFFFQTPQLVILKRNSYKIAIPNTEYKNEILSLLEQKELRELFDMQNTTILKKSATTKAIIFQLPSGRKIFLKQNRNKGLLFTLKNLCRPSRVFRAAAAATLISKAGIPTPQVLLAGEERTGRKLQNGFLGTEIAGESDLMNFFLNDRNSPNTALNLQERMVRTAAKLHDAGIYHGDLKLINFYQADSSGTLGVWDLDSVRYFPNGVPCAGRIRELGRIVSSLLIFAEENPFFPESYFNLADRAKEACSQYEKQLTSPLDFTEQDVVDMAIKRWLSSHKLKHHYAFKGTP